ARRRSPRPAGRRARAGACSARAAAGRRGACGAGRGSRASRGRAVLLGRGRAPDARPLPGTASPIIARVLAVAIVFWCSAFLLVYTHAGYPLVLWALARLRRTRGFAEAPPGELPIVSLVVAAYDEEAVIEEKVRNALALDYPRERLELIVASDGSGDRTAELARAAGADLVLDLPRVGKAAAQDEAVARARGELVAFSDANSLS